MFSLPTADPNAPPEAAAKLSFATSASSVVGKKSTAVIMRKSQTKSTWLWQKMMDPVARAAMGRALSTYHPDDSNVKDQRVSLFSMKQTVYAANTVRLVLATQQMLRTQSAVSINAADVDGRPIARIAEMERLALAVDSQAPRWSSLESIMNEWWACCEQYCSSKMDHMDQAAYVDIVSRLVEVTTFVGHPTLTARVHGLKSAAQVARDDYANDTGSRYAWRGLPRSHFLYGTILSVSRAWAPVEALASPNSILAHDVAFLTALLPLVFDLQDGKDDRAAAEDPSIEAHAPSTPSPKKDAVAALTLSQPLRPASRLTTSRTPPPTHTFTTAPFVPFSHSSAVAASNFPRRMPSASRSRPASGQPAIQAPPPSSPDRTAAAQPQTLSKLVSAAALRFGLKSPLKRSLPSHLQPLVAHAQAKAPSRALVVAAPAEVAARSATPACVKPIQFAAPFSHEDIREAPRPHQQRVQAESTAVKRIFWLHATPNNQPASDDQPSSLVTERATLSPRDRDSSPTFHLAMSHPAVSSAALDVSGSDGDGGQMYTAKALEGFLAILEAAEQRGLGHFVVDLRVYDAASRALSPTAGAKKKPRLTLLDRARQVTGGKRLKTCALPCNRGLTYEGLLEAAQLSNTSRFGITLRRGAFETNEIHDTPSLLLALLLATPERMDLGVRIARSTRDPSADEKATFTIATRPLDVAYIISIQLTATA